MAAVAAGRSLAAKAGQDFASALAGVVENTCIVHGYPLPDFAYLP